MFQAWEASLLLHPQTLCYILSCLFFKNGPTPASFSFIFGLFKQTSLQFLQQIYVKKCPSSIQYQKSNPWPSERESLPITTRPGLPPVCNLTESLEPIVPAGMKPPQFCALLELPPSEPLLLLCTWAWSKQRRRPFPSVFCLHKTIFLSQK